MKNNPQVVRRHLIGVLAWVAGAVGGWLVGVGAEPAPRAASKPAAKTPWRLEGPRLPFEATCFQDWQSATGNLSQEHAERWLAPVQGHALRFTERKASDGRVHVVMAGLARLRAPWPDDAVLRLAFHHNQPLKIHFWNQQEQEGVVFTWRSTHRTYWSALRTSRSPASTIGGEQTMTLANAEMALLATDDGRSRRTLYAFCDIRYQDHSLVLTNGDIRLLTAPLAAPPTDVFLEASESLLFSIAMHRGGPAPDDPPYSPRTLLASDRPAELPWSERLAPGVEFRPLPDGGVEMDARDKTLLPSAATAPLVRAGLHVVDFHIEDPTPETGVFLADDQGQPIQGIEFVRDKRTGLTGYRFGGPSTVVAAVTYGNPYQELYPLPPAGRQPWIRLVLGGGTLRCFASGDGVHWGQAMSPVPQGGNYSRIGVFCQPGAQPRRIVLRGLKVHQLDAVTALAPVQWVERAEDSPVSQPGEEIADLGAWQMRVWQTLPEGVEPAVWRRASALAMLVRGPQPALAKALVEELLREGLQQPWSAASKLKFLHQISLLYDAWSTEDAMRLLAHWERLGLALLREGTDKDLETFRKALMTASIWPQTHRVDPLHERIARGHLLSLVCRERGKDVQAFCAKLRFWHQPVDGYTAWAPHLASLAGMVAWADPTPDRSRRRRTDGPVDAVWRHPLAVQTSKEAYNVMTDLQTALAEKAFRHAFRVLSSATVSQDLSLLIDPKDPRRFESLTTGIRQMMREYPQLQETMNESLGALDHMRVSRALSEGDVEAIKGITVQYHGTHAAADAFRWLGDRLMAGGQFVRAMAVYRQATPIASTYQRHQLTARLRLANAMLGRRTGEPVSRAVRFGEEEIPADQFERLVAEMVEKHADKARGKLTRPEDPLLVDPAVESSAPAPGPAVYRTQARATLEGDWGVQPGSNLPEFSRQVDWTARQLSITFHDDMMIVANRFQVTALDLAGAPRWTYSLGESQGPAHAWPLVPMRPKIIGDRLYVRLLGKNGTPDLFCLDAKTGKLRWSSHYPGEVISDPFIVQEQLLALALDMSPEQPVATLLVAVFDPDNGTIISRRPLLDLSTQWTTQHACQTVVVGDKVLVAAGGALFYGDPLEDLLWVRRCSWSPAAFDVGWGHQHHRPPLVRGERIYAHQVGSRTIDCVELSSGREIWQQTLPGIRRILDCVGDRLLVEVDDLIMALSADSGKVLWSHEALNLLDSCPSAASGKVLYVRGEPLLATGWCPVLVWVDVETGRMLGRCPLWSLAGKPLAVGPLVVHNNRLWCASGVYDQQNLLQPKRVLTELVAAGPLPAEQTGGPEFWNFPCDPGWRLALERALPGWALVTGTHDPKSGLVGEVAGVRDILVTRAAEIPARLARQLTVPAGKPRLVIEVGHDANSSSQFELQIDGLPVRRWTSVPWKTDSDWQKVEIDLSGSAGRTIGVALVQERVGGGPAYAYIRRIALQ